MTRAWVAGLALLAACDPIARLGGDLPDRAALLREIGGEVIVPTHTSLAEAAAALGAAVDAWCAAPEAAGLPAVQDAWRAARLPLKRGEAFAFGPPVDDDRLLAKLDFAPVRAIDVEALLAGDGAVDADALAGRGTTVRGLPVMEYLLFAPGDADAVVAATTPRRCDYLRGLAEDARRSATSLRDAWADGLAGQLGGGGPWSTPQAGMADVVNGLIGEAEALRIGRLGVPAGLYGDAPAQPDLLEAPWARHALPELSAALDGIAAVYGDADGGLAALVGALSEPSDAAVAARVAEARAALDAVPAPLDAAIVGGSPEVGPAYEALYALQRELSTSMASVLGVTVTFTDNDGD